MGIKKYNNIDEIWKDIDRGHKVYWKQENYQVMVTDPTGDNKYSNFSLHNGKCLRLECTYNGFGGLIDPREVEDCYRELDMVEEMGVMLKCCSDKTSVL